MRMMSWEELGDESSLFYSSFSETDMVVLLWLVCDLMSKGAICDLMSKGAKSHTYHTNFFITYCDDILGPTNWVMEAAFLFLIFRDWYGYPSLTSMWLWLSVKRCQVPHLLHKFVHNLLWWYSWSEELGDGSSFFIPHFQRLIWLSFFDFYVIVTQCQKVPSPTPIAQICS